MPYIIKRGAFRGAVFCSVSCYQKLHRWAKSQIVPVEPNGKNNRCPWCKKAVVVNTTTQESIKPQPKICPIDSFWEVISSKDPY